MYNVKIQLVCIFLSLAGIVYSQNTTTTTKISEEEKTRIKQNFKNDNRFYINDDGVVVYTRNESKSDSIKATPLTPAKVRTNELVVENGNDLTKVNTLLNGDEFTSKDTAKVAEDVIIDTLFSGDDNATKSVVSEETVTPVQFFTKSKDEVSVDPVAVDKTVQQENITSTEPDVQVAYGIAKKAEKVNISQEDRDIISKPQTGSAYIVKEERETVSKSAVEKSIAEQEATEIEEAVDDVVSLSKKKASYNSLEEANLAVDQLLVQLKREQKQINKPEAKSNSLSSRVVNGYRPDPNRKNDSKKEASDYDVDDAEVDGDFGTEPTYYINGVVVDKAEVLKLRNKNILSRTIKVRNTASKNPNGEIWIEVRNFQ